MADTISREDVLANRATPGSEGGQVRQEPLRTVGPRDALIADGHQAQDYVPDVDRLHLGYVAQPTVPIRNERGDVIGFVAQEDLQQVLQVPPKPVTIVDLKRAHNAREQSAEWRRHIRPVGPAPLGEEDSFAFNAENGQDRVAQARKATQERQKGEHPLGTATTGNGDGSQKTQTPKQQAVAEAEALGLSTEGTEAEIRERIAKHQAGQTS